MPQLSKGLRSDPRKDRWVVRGSKSVHTRMREMVVENATIKSI